MQRAIAVLLLTALIPAQQPAARPLPPTAQTERLVKLLELDDQRGKASMQLWRIGRDATPALARALSDPRDEIVEAVCAVLAEIGAEAGAALPEIDRQLTTAKGRRLHALRWARHGVGATGFAVVEWAGGSIALLDGKGNLTGRVPAQKGIWDVQPLPQGRFLVTEVGSQKVREIDDKGNELAHLDAPGALRAQRLLSGNTLVACYEGQGVKEFDAKGEVVWQQAAQSCTWVRRLLDGHTLWIDQSKEALYEADARGEVRSIPVGTNAFDAQRLPDGNTLVVRRGLKTATELDATGHEVGTIGDLLQPNTCLRLGDGTTLLGGEKEVTALDRSGKLLWRHAAQWAGCVRR